MVCAMKLNEWRLAKNLSATQLADLLQIKGKNPARTVHRYLTHERIPDRAMIRRIAEVTDGEVSDLDFPDRSQRRAALPEVAA